VLKWRIIVKNGGADVTFGAWKSLKDKKNRFLFCDVPDLH
jgi:hypothetical protein